MANFIENLSHEKRILLAGALCVFTAVVFSHLFAPEPPPRSSEAPLIGEEGPPRMYSGEGGVEIADPLIAASTEPISTTSTASAPPAPIPQEPKVADPLYQADPKPVSRDVVVDTPTTRYVFSTRGGNLQSCRIKSFEEIDPPLRLLEAQRDQAPTLEAKQFWNERIEVVRERVSRLKSTGYIPKGEPVPEERWVELVPQMDGETIGYPLSLRFGENMDDQDLVYTANVDRLDLGEGTSGVLELTAETQRGIRFKKTLTFSSDRPTFEISIETAAPGGTAELQQSLGRHWILEWPDGICHFPFHYPGSQEENHLRAMLSDSMESMTLKSSLLKEGLNKGRGNQYRKTLEGRVGWINVESRYFLASFIPQSPNMQGVYILPRLTQPYPFTEIDTRMGVGLVSMFSDSPQSVLVYAGPKLTGVLEKAATGLDRVVYDSWFETLDKICRLMDGLLAFFYSIIPSYGVAIILLCIFSKIVLYPLTYKQAQMQKKMAVLQPKIQELKEKFKDDPQKLQQEQMKLWKKHGVSPAGCLPMFAQLPIFIALYRTIMSSIEMRGAPFLWIHDLSLPDMSFFIPFSLPFLGNAVNILPFLMTGVSIAQMQQMKKNMPDPNQAQIFMFMNLFFFFILYHFSSGLVLYWMTNSITMMIQQRIMEHLGHAHVPVHAGGAPGGMGADLADDQEEDEEPARKKGPDVPLPNKNKAKRAKKKAR